MTLAEHNQACYDLLDEYMQLKYVSKEAEDEYLLVFQDLNNQRKAALGRTVISTIMLPTDTAAFHHLPNKLTIYRGYHEKRKRVGVSWSLSRIVAEDFAHITMIKSARDIRPSVATGTCLLKDVLAYTNDRNEQEIIVNPEKVKNIHNIIARKSTMHRGAEPLEWLLTHKQH